MKVAQTFHCSRLLSKFSFDNYTAMQMLRKRITLEFLTPKKRCNKQNKSPKLEEIAMLLLKAKRNSERKNETQAKFAVVEFVNAFFTSLQGCADNCNTERFKRVLRR